MSGPAAMPVVVGRDDEEVVAALHATWQQPPGLLGSLAAVSHKKVGERYVLTALVFFLLGGVEALLLRTQLAQPNNEILDPDTYNQLFTMHGSTMMYLFAVPFLEGVANYLLPLMIGSRDLPFPRLNAFNYWTYLFGGALLYSSFLVGEVPDGGWYAYPPFTRSEFTPGLGLDFWLLGITLAEISAIGAAVELIVLIVKHRAPGMSLDRLPLFAWAMLVTSVAIVFAFSVLLAGSVLLQLDRKFGTHFYSAADGGSPLLWQHLFWIFGHPEVYIMFLPATGIVSQIVPAFSRRPMIGYLLVVLAVVATAVLSFGLWVHHMFTVGIPLITLGIFSAASYVIAVPSGVQIFAWISTMWRGRVELRVPMLFILGFLVTFVAGGITGVMVASVPFDWQAHDSYFLVAHFHYVLIGGVVFPAFAGLHHWVPKVTGRLLHHGLALWSFWLVFVGFHLTFFPMHISGLEGMPRRVYTYDAGQGLAGLNLLSTVGAFVLALGFVLSLAALVGSRRWGAPAGDDPWGADSLEWSTSSPPSPENFRTIPLVQSRAPRWEHGLPAPPARHQEVVAALAQEPTAWRGTLGTTPADAEPSEVIYLPGPSLRPLAAGAGLLVLAVGSLYGIVLLVVAGALVSLVAGATWIVDSERSRHAATADFSLAGLPVDVLGTRSVGWWGLVLFLAVLLSVVGSLLYSYFFLGLNAATWPPSGYEVPDATGAAAIAAVLVLLVGVVVVARRRAGGDGRPGGLLSLALVLGAVLAAAHVAEYLRHDLRLDVDAYGSLFFAFHALGAAMALMGVGITALARWAASTGATPDRLRLLVGNAALYWWFALAAWGAVAASLYLSPRVT